jgi:hypothetical protein
MLQINTPIENQPIFYLFIAITVLLVLGYSLGKRKNNKIVKQAFKELINALKPKEQKFTNIGGLTGYHANFTLKNDQIFSRVDSTITLLPRHALLYYPFSKLIRGYDRLFIILHLSSKHNKKIKEFHLIEKKYAKFKGPKIYNLKELNCEEVIWQGLKFYMYSHSSKDKEKLYRLCSKSNLPGQIRHIAFKPEQQKIFIFIVPKSGAIHQTFPKLMSWLNSLFKD